jgi:predicted DNA-binding protein
MTTNSKATTIKVSGDLRDRLNAEAARAGLTAAQLLEQLLAERKRAERFRAIKRARESMTEAERADYLRDFNEWQRSSLDDLRW